jgi:hypothetical protein
MGSTLLNTFILIFVLNGMLLMGETYLVTNTPYSYNFQTNSVIGLFFNLDATNNPTGLTSEFSGSIPTTAEKSAIQSGENTNIFIDAIGILFTFVVLLIKLLVAPLLLLALGVNLPLAFNLFIIMPIVLIYAFGLVFLIRGSSQ